MSCEICSKVMGSDNMKRHMKQNSKKNEKSQNKKEELRNTLLNDKHECEQKFELRRSIHKIIIKDGVPRESQGPTYKEALDLYIVYWKIPF